MLPSAILVLTAGWFAACSQDDDISNTPPTEQNQIPITFGSDISDAQPAPTRATPTPFSTKRQSFVFSGYKHFDNALSATGRQKVFPAYTMLYNAAQANTTTDNTSGWHYVGAAAGQTIKYWDHSATAYRFFAISGSYTAKHETETERGLSIYANGMNEDAGGDQTPYVSHTEIVYNADFKKSVTLKFYKPFVRVRFMLVDSEGKAITAASRLATLIDENSFSFRPTDNTRRVGYSATLNSTHYLTGTAPHRLVVNTEEEYFTYPNGITTPYESPSAAGYAFVAETAKERWWHVLAPPTSYGSFTLSFSYSGNTRSAVVPAEYMQWQFGYAYTYVFKVSEDGESNFDPQLYTYTQWQSGYSETVNW